METFYDPIEILKFWFGNHEYKKWWFISNSQLDQEIANKYYEQMRTLYDNWSIENYSNVPSNRIISDIILLDQFSRNIARVKPPGTIEIIHYTKKAEALSEIWINQQFYMTEPISHTVFAFLPIRHSKDKIAIGKLIPILDTIKTIGNNNSNPIFIKFYTHTLRALQ